MIDIQKAKKVFKEYVKKYDDTNPKIKIKMEHILKVAENSKKIATELNLSQEDVLLAELIGLLHDIGRFEQVKIYNTFLDSVSINHSIQGLKVLFEEGLIREFVEEEKYDNIIYKAIINHNRDCIEQGLTDKELLHAKIIRDSDKLDIFRVVMTEEKIENALSIKTEDVSKELISDVIYSQYVRGEHLDYSKRKTNIDIIICWCAFVYDFNFEESLKQVQKEDYVNRLIDRVDYKDELTKERMENVRKIANEYIINKCKG